MPAISRRQFLKTASIGLGAAMLPKGAAAKETVDASGHVSMLYDATMCTGCNACTSACRQWNGTEVEPDASGRYDAPTELTADTWSLILLNENDDGHCFVKRQCMHCVDPACVSGCPVTALEKSADGPVTYDADRCIGCRYCMYTCPFHVPRFEWDEVLPEVTKCTMCTDRLAVGDGPACAERCPTGALIWGRRDDLLADAEGRLAASDDKYVNKVYGKDDAGGTSVLYLSPVPFEELGLPDLGTEPVPQLSERTSEVFVPAILIGGPLLLAGIRYVTNREGWREP